MDVTPISKAGVSLQGYQPEETGASSSERPTVNSGQAAAQPRFAEDVQVADPVRRAEQAIGSFFEDSNNPKGRFSIDHDSDSGRFVYRLINSDTGEVLKQFPGDYVLRRVAYYRELEGLAFDSKV